VRLDLQLIQNATVAVIHLKSQWIAVREVAPNANTIGEIDKYLADGAETVSSRWLTCDDESTTLSPAATARRRITALHLSAANLNTWRRDLTVGASVVRAGDPEAGTEKRWSSAN
jgi:hypothetical protein